MIYPGRLTKSGRRYNVGKILNMTKSSLTTFGEVLDLMREDLASMAARFNKDRCYEQALRAQQALMAVEEL